MASTNSRKIFVNLPVRDLKKAMNFFSTLGFTFNKQFTNEQGAVLQNLHEAGIVRHEQSH